MKKLLISMAALALLAFAATALAASDRRGGGDTNLSRTTSDDGPGHGDHGRGRGRGGDDDRGRDDDDRREAGEDVRGPCDEAEHAGDPRCAGSRSTTTRTATTRATTTRTATTPTTTANSSAGARTVRVIERSYSISFSPKPRAGRTTFLVSNASGDDHDFWLTGGGKTLRTQRLDGGGTQRITATLKKGARYRYFCAVGSHAQAGMSGSFVAR